VPPAPPISDAEPLTRFVTDDELLRASGDVHWRAFRPKPAEAELSIARISDLPDGNVWDLGETLAGATGRPVHGRADFTKPNVQAARYNGSRMTAVDDEPPTRHALITGWPVDSQARKVLAMAIAAESKQVVRLTS
jgi:hypothetical protein